MIAGVLGALGAGALAVVVSLVEVRNSYPKPFVRSAILWLVARTAIDGIVAAAGALGVIAASGNAWLAVAAGGLGGPALLRSNFVVSGSGSSKTAIGIGAIVERLRSRFDDAIENESAVAVTAWVHNVVLPNLADVSVSALADRVNTYLEMRTGITDIASRMRFVTDTAAQDTPNARAAIILSLLEISGGARMINSLLAAPSKAELMGVPATSRSELQHDARQLHDAIQSMARDLASGLGAGPAAIQLGILHYTDEQVARMLREALTRAMPNVDLGPPTLASDLIARADAAPAYIRDTSVVIFGVTCRTGRTMEVFRQELQQRYKGQQLVTVAIIAASPTARPDYVGFSMRLTETQWVDVDPERGISIRQGKPAPR